MDVKNYLRFPQILADLGCRPSAQESQQSKYLETYLQVLQAKSYVVEESYIDAGHMKDYASYYAFRGESVRKETTRLHFFTLEQDQVKEGFEYFCNRTPKYDCDEYLNAGYLGFVVVRPLTATVIGRTCLKTYQPGLNAPTSERHFPLLRSYKVMLAGIRLSVRSVAFQEQDNEIAACSATAIWHALHALPHRITTGQIESLFEISNSASVSNGKMPALGETAHRFPTTGLNADQIQHYLQTKGIDCLVRGFSGKTHTNGLLNYVQTFCEAGFPIILVGRLYVSKSRDTDYTLGELHAITVLGYSVKLNYVDINSSSRVEKIYAHDDTLGPFSRLEVESPKKGSDFNSYLKVRNDEQFLSNFALHLYTESSRMHRRFLPIYAIVPIESGVRYPYENVDTFARTLAEIIRGQLETMNGQRPIVEWALQLQHGSDFKVSLRGVDWVDEEVRSALLKASYEYVWVAEFSEVGVDKVTRTRRLTAVFDANQLRQDGAIEAIFASGDTASVDSYNALLARTINAWRGNKNRDNIPENIHPTFDKLALMIP